MAGKRKQHTSEFKARVALDAIRGIKTLSELTVRHGSGLGKKGSPPFSIKDTESRIREISIEQVSVIKSRQATN